MPPEPSGKMPDPRCSTVRRFHDSAIQRFNCFTSAIQFRFKDERIPRADHDLFEKSTPFGDDHPAIAHVKGVIPFFGPEYWFGRNVFDVAQPDEADRNEPKPDDFQVAPGDSVSNGENGAHQ